MAVQNQTQPIQQNQLPAKPVQKVQTPQVPQVPQTPPVQQPASPNNIPQPMDPTAVPQPKQSIFKKWWFWVLIGIVSVFGVVLLALFMFL